MDKQTKKDIKAVVRKYLDTRDPNSSPRFNLLLNGGALALAGADFALTGGVFSTTLVAINGAIAAISLAEIFNNNSMKKRTNAAGQQFESSEIVALTLKKMEGDLRSAFDAAAALHPQQNALADYNKLVEEVRKDVNTLAPVFRISAGDDYKFVVRQPWGENAVTADKGMDWIEAQHRKIAQEAKAKAPEPPPPSPPPKKKRGFNV